MPRLPNLNALRMFDAAARHSNFRLAAEELHLTQGAVAQQVRRLEADLDLKLFERRARGLTLTQQGRAFHAPIQRAFALIQDAAEKITQPTGQVTLNVTPSFASKWLVPHLAEFTRTHPEIEIQVIATEELTRFSSDRVEIAIRQTAPPFNKNMRMELLTTLDLCAVCGPEFINKNTRFQTLQDFVGHTLIQDGQRHWDRLFERSALKPNKRMLRFNRTALAMDAAATGQGITLAPQLLVEGEIATGRLIKLWDHQRHDKYGFYIARPKVAASNRDSETVINWIHSRIRQAITSRDD